MSLILLPLNVAKDAVLVEQKFGTTFVVEGTVDIGNFPSVQSVDDNGASLTVDTDDGPLSVDDNGSSLTVDGTVLAEDFLIEVTKGNIPGHSALTKFGNAVVGTTPSPITSNNVYQSPTAAAALEFLSDSGSDATGGVGATKITYEGLDANWDYIKNEISTNGLTPVALPDSLTRLTRWYVSESGSYADLATPSYVGNLTIQGSGGGAVWSIISATTPYPAQSEIGVYSLPRGKRMYLISKHIFTDTNKSANVYLLARENADDVVSPYSGVRRLQEREVGVSGNVEIDFQALKGPYYGPCDVGFIGSVASGNADISVEFDMLIIDDGF